jgi:hypothetical protein
MPITTPNYFVVNNPPFEPQMFNILSITNAFPCVVTTTADGINPADNGYLTGLIVRLVIPQGFGMVQANGFYSEITVLNSSQFSMPIDTTTMDPFVVPAYNPGHNGTPAQTIPIAEDNEMLRMAVQNVLPRP